MIVLGDEINAAARLFYDRGIDTPLLDAQLLAAHALGCSRIGVIAHPERPLTEGEAEDYHLLTEKRAGRCPLAYLLGRKEFRGIEIEVAPGVLVPRPETEVLVEQCVRRLDRQGARHDGPTIADLGTGSGAIAVALGKELPSARVYATEISPIALKVARANVQKQNLSTRVVVLEGDFLDPLLGLSVLFDAIVSNPPYIPTGDIDSLQPEVSRFEPREALDGGSDGLDSYRVLLPRALELLTGAGFTAVEIGAGQASAVCEIARRSGYARVEVVPDLAGIQRVVIAYR